MVAVIPSSEFDQEVLKSDKPVLVDLYADWCGPCVAMGPVLDELNNEIGAQVKIVKIDVDTLAHDGSDPVFNLMKERNIRGIPAFLLFKSGEIVGQTAGSRPKANMKTWIEQTLGLQLGTAPAVPKGPAAPQV